jgi:hypothetical protein
MHSNRDDTHHDKIDSLVSPLRHNRPLPLRSRPDTCLSITLLLLASSCLAHLLGGVRPDQIT